MDAFRRIWPNPTIPGEYRAIRYLRPFIQPTPKIQISGSLPPAVPCNQQIPRGRQFATVSPLAICPRDSIIMLLRGYSDVNLPLNLCPTIPRRRRSPQVGVLLPKLCLSGRILEAPPGDEDRRGRLRSCYLHRPGTTDYGLLDF